MHEDDPYKYPGTEVLRNRLDIRDARTLQAMEAELTAARMRGPLPEISMTPEGYQDLHRHLFQDVYPWAGEYRTCNLRKSLWFEEATTIKARMVEQFGRLNAEGNLKGLRLREFAERAAEHLCELNDIHPFREGNGRTNRLFLQVLADQAGIRLRMTAIKREAWMEASIRGFHYGDYQPMTQVLRKAVVGYRRENCIERTM